MSRDALFDAWRNADARVRWLIGIPVVAISVIALYAGVIEPLRSSSRNLRASLPQLEARRDAIRAQTEEARAQPARVAKPIDNAVIQSALEQHRLKERQPALEATGENRLRLQIARAPFFSIWPFFQTLQTDHGIRIVSLHVDKLDAGNARVEAVLAAGER